MNELSENISTYLFNLFGNEFLSKYRDYIQRDYVTHLRISSHRNDQEKIINRLQNYEIKLQTVKSIPDAFIILNGADKAGKTIESTIGKYYIQSLSSMIPPLVLNPSAKDKVLDLCAAPGSKSTQLSELMYNKGTLYSNEPSLPRIKSLVHNIDKMNSLNIGVIKYKGELLSKVFENYFDKILVDVPCSGLGIMQKKGEVSNWWNLKQAEKIAALQLKLLVSAVKMLKVGGELVYSTCTMTIEENEIVVNKVLRKHPVEVLDIDLPVKSHGGFTNYRDEKLNLGLKKSRRIIPWEINSEGFFIVKLRKTGETEPINKLNFKDRNIQLLHAEDKKIKKYLQDINDKFGISLEVLSQYKYIVKTRDIFFINKDWESNNLDFFQRIGNKFGQIDKRDFANLHTHAAQVFSNEITQNIVELKSNEELDIYFRGGTLRGLYEPLGRKAIKYHDYIVGTAIATKDGLKSQFPRSKRTHEIVFPNKVK